VFREGDDTGAASISATELRAGLELTRIWIGRGEVQEPVI